MPTQFEIGFLVGLLVGEGHFGGDGRQPHVTLRMHVRHEAIFRWLERTFPRGRLYGPYHHGGRDYLQWMARGSFLRDELAPLLDRFLAPELDQHSFDRFQLMKARYPHLTAGRATLDAPPVRSSHRDADRRLSQSAAAKNEREPAPARPGGPARDHDEFADLFAELRQVWPS